jgi:hypothetical protein
MSVATARRIMHQNGKLDPRFVRIWAEQN